jgi:hypothetical protein
MIKLELGKRYVSRYGEITAPLVESISVKTKYEYPFMDPVTCMTYAPCGSYCLTTEENEEDLVKEYEGITFNGGRVGYGDGKKILNFWEAREAALAGKKVKKLSSDLIYTAKDFSVTSEFYFSTNEMGEEWQLVEEPKQYIRYFNIHKDTQTWVAHSTELEAVRWSEARSSQPIIAITVDENGKLIEARNV